MLSTIGGATLPRMFACRRYGLRIDQIQAPLPPEAFADRPDDLFGGRSVGVRAVEDALRGRARHSFDERGGVRGCGQVVDRCSILWTSKSSGSGPRPATGGNPRVETAETATDRPRSGRVAEPNRTHPTRRSIRRCAVRSRR
jgi:hypothetical protein